MPEEPIDDKLTKDPSSLGTDDKPTGEPSTPPTEPTEPVEPVRFDQDPKIQEYIARQVESRSKQTEERTAELQEQLDQVLAQRVTPQGDDQIPSLDELYNAESTQVLVDGLTKLQKHTLVQERKNLATEMRMLVSEMMSMEKHPDYEEVIKTYIAPEVKNNPALYEYLKSQKNPAEAFYQHGLKAKVGNPDYLSEMRKKIYSEAEKDILQKMSQPRGHQPIAGVSTSSGELDESALLAKTDEELAKLPKETLNKIIYGK